MKESCSHSLIKITFPFLTTGDIGRGISHSGGSRFVRRCKPNGYKSTSYILIACIYKHFFIMLMPSTVYTSDAWKTEIYIYMGVGPLVDLSGFCLPSGQTRQDDDVPSSRELYS